MGIARMSVALAAVCASGLALAEEPEHLDSCPSAGARAQLLETWKTAGTPRLESIAREAGATEAAVLASLPAELAVGTSGSAFHEVWKSLQEWPDSLTVIIKDGHVFEVHGRIAPGEASTVSRYFNLEPGAPGLTGHLRPDLVSAVYASSLAGRGRVEHGVLFLSLDGAVSFGVYVPNEHGEEDPGVAAAFERTRAAIAEMPRVCDGDQASG